MNKLTRVDIATDIAKKYKQMRLNKKIKLVEIERDTGVKVQDVSRFEISSHNISINTLKKLCDCIDVELIIEIKDK